MIFVIVNLAKYGYWYVILPNRYYTS